MNAVFAASLVIGTDAIAGCQNGVNGNPPVPPHAGYVQNKDDCYDKVGAGAAVHPGQTLYFSTGYGLGNTNFDYNCDGTLEKQFAESNQCYFCPGTACGSTTCNAVVKGTTPPQASHSCRNLYTCLICAQTKGPLCSPVAADEDALYNVTACGATGSLYHCGTCPIAGGSLGAGTYVKAQTQNCN